MEGFQQLNGSFKVLFDALTASLKPVLTGLAMTFKVIDQILTPIFTALASVMQPFEMLANGLLDLIDSTGILGFVVKIIAGVFSAIGLVIGGIVLGIQYLWEGVLKIVRGIIAFFTAGAGTKEIDATIKKHEAAIEANKKAMERRPRTSAPTPRARATSSAGVTATGAVTATGNVTATGKIEMKNFDLSKYGIGGPPVDVIDIGGWGYAAGSMAGAEAARGFVEASALLNGASADAAAALGQAAYDDFLALGDSADTAARGLASFSQSLTNVPEGFRYAAAAFNATGTDGRAAFAGSEGGDTIVIQGSVISGEELAIILENYTRRTQYKHTGSGSGWADNNR
jgi:hypothetical protein